MPGLGLVAGYDSDSSSDSESKPNSIKEVGHSKPAAVNSKSSIVPQNGGLGGLLSSLPPPKSSSSSSGLSSNDKKPAGGKRKQHQIRIEASSRLSDASDDERDATEIKKAKANIKKSDGPASSSKHSLFGMLPAPTRKGPPSPPKSAQEEEFGQVGEGRLTVTEPAAADATGKKKGNADFRAMLGLKPKADQGGAVSPSKPTESPAMKTENELERSAVSTMNMPPTSNLRPLPSPNAASLEPPPKAASPEYLNSTTSSAMDFFGLSSPVSKVATSEILPVTAPRPSFGTRTAPAAVASASSRTLSAAPTVEEASPYPGWLQNPDGSWIPVTPEAQEAFAAHHAAQAASGADPHAEEREREMERLRAQGVDIDSLATIDAGTQAGSADFARRPQPSASMAHGGTTSSLDAKYAQAAAAMAHVPAGPGESDEVGDGSDQKKRRDKMTSTRARHKGQLTSLFAQAEEKRDSLEEKWAKGRANRQGAREKYGF